jgi:hypothetical protein
MEAYDLEELPVLLRRATDEELGKWKALLKEEDDRLQAVLEHPHSALWGIDKLQAIEDRQDAVLVARMELKDEQEKRVAKP